MGKGKLVLTHGLPGSGKSTWAKEYQRTDPENIVVVELDELREKLFGKAIHKKPPSKEQNTHLIALQKKLIHDNLQKGKIVVLSDTNLNVNFMSENAKIAEKYGVPLEQEYFDVPVDVCKERNRVRGENGGRFVPEHVIDRMAKNGYGKDGKIKEFQIGTEYSCGFERTPSEGRELLDSYNAEMSEKNPFRSKKLANFDMDGTLVDTREISDRFMSGKKRNFDAFHKGSEFVPPNEKVLADLMKAHEEGYDISITTARSDDYAEATINWLKKYNVPVSRLYMRKSGDFRPDYMAKGDILNEILADGLKIIHCWDDNPQAVRRWEENNIRVTKVPFHEPVSQDTSDYNGNYDPVVFESAFSGGKCLVCGRVLKSGGTVGPTCAKK